MGAVDIDCADVRARRFERSSSRLPGVARGRRLSTQHERAGGRDVFSRDGIRVEPDRPLFALPGWSAPIPPIARADAGRLFTMLASARTPAYAARTGKTEPEAQVTS